MPRKPQDPTRFSIRISQKNLEELNRLTQTLPDVDNRNAAINRAIETYILYEKHRPLIQALEGSRDKIVELEKRIRRLEKKGK